MNDCGFGLAPVKREGYVEDLKDGVSCDALSSEFSKYFSSNYKFSWYTSPFKNLFRGIAQKAWHNALLTKERNKQGA